MSECSSFEEPSPDHPDGADSSSPLFRSLSMSQNLALSVVEEVPHMIRLQVDATATASTSQFRSVVGTNVDQELELSQEEYNYRQKELPVSKNGGLNSYLEPKTIPKVASLKRTVSAGKRNDILIGIVVSRWDNIVGPQCSYLWTEEMTSLFYPGNLPKHITRLIKYVTDHTVDHHEVDGNLVSHSTMKSGLCIVPDLNLVYMSLSIRIPVDPLPSETTERSGMTVPHSVAVLASLDYLQHFLLMRPLIGNWLSEFAPKVGVLICRNKLQMSMINSWCAELCKTMAAVRTCWWQKNLSEKKAMEERIRTRVEVQDNDVNGNATPKIQNFGPVEHWDYLPPPSTTKSALELMLTSHLSTSYSTIVVGPDAYAINQVIRFLLCFSKADDGYCSRYVLPTLPDTFMKGLYVQGLIYGEIGEKSISANQINSNRHPFTHVDLSSKCTKVRQTPVHSHQSQREITLGQELTALWQSTPFISPTTELFPQQVTEIGRFVSKFVTELLMLKPERRYGRLLLFRRMLHSKAISLITYLQSIQFKPRKEKIQLTKRMKETLGLDEAEFLIVQTTAEKIRPGIVSLIRS